MLGLLTNLSRDSRPDVFRKKGVLRSFVKSQENTFAKVSFLMKWQA